MSISMGPGSIGPGLLALSAWDTFLGLAFGIGAAVVGLGLIIFIHELGHFLLAKACGVRVDKFYVGFDFFGLRLARVRWGETEYGIGIFPLGGYVKMFGQDDNPANYQREAEATRVRTDRPNTSPPTEDASVPSDAAAPASGDLPAEPVEGQAPADPQGEYTLHPRSYAAKSVPQRMAIISAGVIFNLISGAIFAILAYQLGVPYTPTVIGNVTPGSAAWTGGLRPGDKIVQIGSTSRSENLRFREDVIVSTHFSSGREMPVTVKRAVAPPVSPAAETGDDTETAPDSPTTFVDERLTLVPATYTVRNRKGYSLGVQMAHSASLEYAPVEMGSVAADPAHNLRPGETVVAVSGPFGTVTVQDSLELTPVLASYADQPLTFTLRQPENPDASLPNPPQYDDQGTRQVTIGPQRNRGLGVAMTPGPISSIRPGSPAADAGLAPGDVLVALDGAPIPSVVTIDDQLREAYLADPPREVEVRFQRGGQEFTRAITPIRPESALQTIHSYREFVGLPAGSFALGIAYPVTQTIRAVTPDGPAAQVGLQVGDTITELAIAYDQAEIDDFAGRFPKLESTDESAKYALDPERAVWPEAFAALKNLPPQAKVTIKYLRDGETEEATVTLADDAGYYAPRGLNFAPTTEMMTGLSFGESVQLGLAEIPAQATMMGTVLRKLVTRDIELTVLGGPIGIFQTAGMEARRGAGAFFLFLTMVSVNLAIINFLPIPVLDGGHMMFLLVEGIRGKPLSIEWQGYLTLIGLAMVLTLMIGVLTIDFMNLPLWMGWD